MALLVDVSGQPLTTQGEVTFNSTLHFNANKITKYEGFTIYLE